MTGIKTAASYWEQLFQFYRSVRIKMLPRMKKLWFKTNRSSIHTVLFEGKMSPAPNTLHNLMLWAS